MTSPRPRRRILALLATPFVVSALLAPSAAAQDGDESVRGDLDQALEDYLEAEDALNASKDRQDDIEAEIEETEELVADLTAEVQDFAASAYMAGDLTSMTAILSAESPQDALDAALMVDFLGNSRAVKIEQLVTAQEDLTAQQELLDGEIATQAENLAVMEDATLAAARELAAVGGDDAVGPSVSDARPPDPVPRNDDGSLPWEGCQADDPTTSGCLTPRMLHALEQTELAGFTRYVACYRGGSFGEHPKGRACDFSAEPGGFGGDAGGTAYDYGQNLAGWYVQYADELAVQYVIWYRQIWMPSSGWKTYSGAGGDPSSDHTNHVHVSIR